MARPVGSTNKNKGAIKRRLKEAFGDDFDIVQTMALNAYKLQQAADAQPDEANLRKLVIDGWEKVAQYVEPKLKATEISTVDSDGEVTGFKIEVVSAKDNPAN